MAFYKRIPVNVLNGEPLYVLVRPSSLSVSPRHVTTSVIYVNRSLSRVMIYLDQRQNDPDAIHC